MHPKIKLLELDDLLYTHRKDNYKLYQRLYYGISRSVILLLQIPAEVLHCSRMSFCKIGSYRLSVENKTDIKLSLYNIEIFIIFLVLRSYIHLMCINTAYLGHHSVSNIATNSLLGFDKVFFYLRVYQSIT